MNHERFERLIRIMNDNGKEAMKLALEALELHGEQYPHMVKGYCLDAITALREALAEQPAQPATYTCGVCGVSMQMEQPAQPLTVAWQVTEGGAYKSDPYWVAERVDGKGWNAHKDGENLLLADSLERCKEACELDAQKPAQRTWVGLTDEEVIAMSRYDLEYAALIGEVQRRLKEKNT